jgi:hypothetical protein
MIPSTFESLLHAMLAWTPRPNVNEWEINCHFSLLSGLAAFSQVTLGILKNEEIHNLHSQELCETGSF